MDLKYRPNIIGKIWLAVNEDSTKNKLSTSRGMIKVDNYFVDVVKGFFFTAMPQLPEKMLTVWRSFVWMAFLKQVLLWFQSAIVSVGNWLDVLYTLLILSVFLYDVEAWTWLKLHAAALRIFKRHDFSIRVRYWEH